MATTSGTVSAYPYNQRRVLDHAFRRAGVAVQKVSAEDLQFATDNIYTLTSEWISAGFPLWTRQFFLLGAQVGSPDVFCPVGTNDVFHTYWRILQPYRGPAQSTGAASVNQLFAGQPNADVVIGGPNPGVAVNFGAPQEVDTIGVLLGNVTAITAALQVQTSPDGATWTTIQTLPSATYAPLAWTYFDLNPTITAQFVRLLYVTGGSWTLNQLNFGLANGTDTEIGPLNIDDYYNLPNKLFQSDRANSAYLDRQLTQPDIKIWPTLNLGGFYNGCLSVLARRYIQDPGALTNNVEVPQRWLEALQWKLAKLILSEMPDPSGDLISLSARQQRMTNIDKELPKAEALAWSEERNRSPIRWAPNIRPYTA